MFKAGSRILHRTTDKQGTVLSSRATPSRTGQCLVNILQVFWDDGSFGEVPATWVSLLEDATDEGD